MNALNDFDLLTLADVAQLLHCSKAHVCNAVAGRVRGCPAIPAVSLGRRKLVRRETLLSWMNKTNMPPPVLRFPYRQFGVPGDAHKENFKCANAYQKGSVKKQRWPLGRDVVGGSQA